MGSVCEYNLCFCKLGWYFDSKTYRCEVRGWNSQPAPEELAANAHRFSFPSLDVNSLFRAMVLTAITVSVLLACRRAKKLNSDNAEFRMLSINAALLASS